MQITSVTVYGQWQPFVSGIYTCSGGRSAAGFESTIVRVETDEGITGWGEEAPLGAFYSPAFTGGTREALRLLAPLVIGIDPREANAVDRLLDLHVNAHPYAKSALVMACWDIAARSAGLPLAEALGGRFGSSVDLYRSVSQAAPEQMVRDAEQYVAQGYRRIQVKVGLDPRDDVERMHAVLAVLPTGTVVYADANGGWLPAQAKQFLRATRDLDYTLEQPCATHDGNRAVRAVCDRPMVLDESIDTMASLLRAHHDRMIDGITIKIARSGGNTTARLIRDVAVDLGLQVTVEDTGGAQIDTAAMAHLSMSTPESARAHTVDFHNWVTVANGVTGMTCDGGVMTAPTAPGLGVDVDPDVFGEPLFAATATGPTR